MNIRPKIPMFQKGGLVQVISEYLKEHIIR